MNIINFITYLDKYSVATDFLTLFAGQTVMVGKGNMYKGKWVSLTAITVGMVLYFCHKEFPTKHEKTTDVRNTNSHKVLQNEKWSLIKVRINHFYANDLRKII